MCANGVSCMMPRSPSAGRHNSRRSCQALRGKVTVGEAPPCSITVTR